MAAATNTGAVLMSFDTNERPPVVALPAQARAAGRAGPGIACLRSSAGRLERALLAA